ncbi:MAG: cation:proton antiporter [Sandaracinaceae bacterium]|nr:cation:proton antiporter [Sandaracinaceae bacterium]
MHFDSLTRLLLQVGVIIGVSQVFSRLGRRIRQPSVVSEILAGVALGPSLLGVVWPEASAFLFPPTSLDGLEAVAQLGLILFMFLVGLELDPGVMKGRSRSAIAISQAGIVVPFALGLVLASQVHARLSPVDTPFLVVRTLPGRSHEHHGVPGARAAHRRARPAGVAAWHHRPGCRCHRRRHGLVPARLRGVVRARRGHPERGHYGVARGGVRGGHGHRGAAPAAEAGRARRGAQPRALHRGARVGGGQRVVHARHRHPRALRRVLPGRGAAS